ncbi:poly(ADP-ribose) glycohydrolase-like isoform X2 [Homarus americanus]|uniref:poly(ADP-ribose) glycohydrolase-like isoform X2 n=1 Tax=Homarus americanus TaxID=6706 RepID=UPI001C45A02B|nr:poly(ADP-ribose) glycohydrolase-like isoform X2 [Homarus americanus]XP_042228894.1 poly(ADP-ribose) glycohydrolase-like isoform X2 [Homarus americanus]
MSEYPPKKKLRQVSLVDMFMPSTSEEVGNKHDNNQTTIDIESDSSQNIQSSIECLRLNSFSSDIGASDDKELMETNDETQKGGLEYETHTSGNCIREHDKPIHGSSERERGVSEHFSLEKKRHSDVSPKKKKMEFAGEQNDYQEASKRNADQRNAASTSPRAKTPSKGPVPKKLSKIATPKKSPRRSPTKEKEGRVSNGRSSERRNILADAAERRMRLGVTTPSDRVEQEGRISPDIFDDDDDFIKAAEKTEITWCGSPLSSLEALSSTNLNLPSVYPAPDHTVLVKLPISPGGGVPAPHPSSYTDIWDQYHVRMPCSPKSQYPLGKGSDSLVPRWSVICQALRRGITSVEELQSAILEYNSRYATKWKFKGLHHLIEQEFEEEERDYFFSNTLPAMIRLALNLPKLVTQPPPLLVSRAAHSITLSQMQIASLLANAFFCTFPRRNAKGSETEYANYPDINFNRLFFHKEKRALEKMKCLLNYFRRVTRKEATGNVTFTRQYICYQDLPAWESSSNHLPKIHINTNGLIEDASGLLQADFANKYLGGGVLGLGCVQEEIRFVLSPELIVSRLFTQALGKSEALIITGVEQYNDSTGYASTFSWKGSHEDTTPVDAWGRRLCQVTAIDALHFTRQPQVQYRPTFVRRELNKAYAGFKVLNNSPGVQIAVATGNWGCGAFKGDPRLKSLIQLAVCGYIGRDVAYFTFGDQKLCNDLAAMHIFLKENNVSVGELVQLLIHHGSREWADGSDLFQYIYHNLGAYESETDNEDSAVPAPPQNTNTRKEMPAVKRNITDYFKKLGKTYPTPAAATAVTHGATHRHASTSKQVLSSGTGVVGKDSLSEEKILEVLTECDRLVGGQKVKTQEACDSGPSLWTQNKYLLDQSKETSDTTKFKSSKRDSEGKDRGKTEERKNTVSKSTSEPNRLLSFLDDIDKGMAS